MLAVCSSPHMLLGTCHTLSCSVCLCVVQHEVSYKLEQAQPDLLCPYVPVLLVANWFIAEPCQQAVTFGCVPCFVQHASSDCKPIVQLTQAKAVPLMGGDCV